MNVQKESTQGDVRFTDCSNGSIDGTLFPLIAYASDDAGSVKKDSVL